MTVQLDLEGLLQNFRFKKATFNIIKSAMEAGGVISEEDRLYYVWYHGYRRKQVQIKRKVNQALVGAVLRKFPKLLARQKMTLDYRFGRVQTLEALALAGPLTGSEQAELEGHMLAMAKSIRRLKYGGVSSPMAIQTVLPLLAAAQVPAP